MVYSVPCKHIWRLGATMGTWVLLVRRLNFYFLLSISKNRNRKFSFEEEFFIVLVKLKTGNFSEDLVQTFWHQCRTHFHYIRLQVRSSGPATFFHGDWSWNNFYGHSPSTADSRRSVVRYWWKDVHLLLVKRLGLSLPRIKCGYQIASMRSKSSRLSQLQFNILNVYAKWPICALYLSFAFLMWIIIWYCYFYFGKII